MWTTSTGFSKPRICSKMWNLLVGPKSRSSSSETTPMIHQTMNILLSECWSWTDWSWKMECSSTFRPGNRHGMNRILFLTGKLWPKTVSLQFNFNLWTPRFYTQIIRKIISKRRPCVHKCSVFSRRGNEHGILTEHILFYTCFCFLFEVE